MSIYKQPVKFQRKETNIEDELRSSPIRNLVNEKGPMGSTSSSPKKGKKDKKEETELQV